jgi:hypothetical protein
MRGWRAQAETPFTITKSATATRARSTFPLALRRLRIVVGLVAADVAHGIVMRAVELITVAGDVLRVLDYSVMSIGHPLVQASHTLQLLFQE